VATATRGRRAWPVSLPPGVVIPGAIVAALPAVIGPAARPPTPTTRIAIRALIAARRSG
jgi:hypothetical protein